jgi:hypothetical protein
LIYAVGRFFLFGGSNLIELRFTYVKEVAVLDCPKFINGSDLINAKDLYLYECKEILGLSSLGHMPKICIKKCPNVYTLKVWKMLVD